MTPLLDSRFITNKEASDFSGYHSDYISRLCREEKVEGLQVGRAWFINRESLELFIKQQDERKKELSKQLSQQREQEYRVHKILETPTVETPVVALPVSSGVVTAIARAKVKKSLRLHQIHPAFRESFAVLVTVLVLAGSVLAAQTGLVERGGEKVVRVLTTLDNRQPNVAAEAPRALIRVGNALSSGIAEIITQAPSAYQAGVLALVATPRDQSAAIFTAPTTNGAVGERVALSTYQTITKFFNKVTSHLALLFGIRTKSLVVVPEDSLHLYPSTSLPEPKQGITGTYSQVINNQTFITNGVSLAYIDTYINNALKGFGEKISGQILDTNALKGSTNNSGGSASNSTITNATITNSTFSGSVSATTLSVSGNATFSGTTTLSGPVVFGGITGSIQCLHVDASGVISGTGSDCGAGGGSGITSLNGLVATTQTFATSSADTNLKLAITSSGSTHTFTPSWSGILSVIRGGTGLSTVSANGLLIGDSAGTGYTQVATSSLGIS